MLESASLLHAAPLAPTDVATPEARRDWLFANVRRRFRRFVDEEGRWQCPPAASPTPDPRVLVQVSLPMLLGEARDRVLARQLLLDPLVQQRINLCSFTTEYILTVLHAAGDAVSADLRDLLLARISDNLLHYASKDLQHHGYNDNHVTLATASLILGGEMTGNAEAIEEGQVNLLNFRDTFLRRGFMHETNDCYIPHALYPMAAVAEWSTDADIRQLARDCEARIWADWIGHWHVNLSRKPGPSARDYTGGRLHPLVISTGLWYVFGPDFGQPAFPPQDVFADAPPEERHFAFNGTPADGHWNLGFLAHFAAHHYHVPADLEALMHDRPYPHIICGTHETGSYLEATTRAVRDADGTERLENSPQNYPLPDVVPFSAREIFSYQYQEQDWAMGTASQRMIGNCPNNNWGVYYRKAAPLTRTADQGLLFCSYTINDKRCTGEHAFIMDPAEPTAINKEDVEHWFDNGRYAGMQHERTSLMLYRPRIHERHAITSLATTLVFPLCFNNRVEHIWLGDEEIRDFQGEAHDYCDIFIADGPLYIGIRPLLSRPQGTDVHIRASRDACWGAIDIYGYRGPALSLSEMDVCRIGGGFLCEVAPREEFGSIEAFKRWFRAGQILDDQTFFMRQVRYHRDGLDMGLRWDVWSDNIMYRTLQGRDMPKPPFSCNNIDASKLPWLSGDVSGMDHFTWAVRQARRPMAEKCTEPGRILS